jgi:C4-dicarboxylate-specific signal transduction histidine kinase
VLENCLENARKKREREPDIQIVAELVAGDTPSLVVCDTGTAIPEQVRVELFRAPVSSNRSGGLGIGLFQAARHAHDAGYELTLDQNEAGGVRFRLAARQ